MPKLVLLLFKKRGMPSRLGITTSHVNKQYEIQLPISLQIMN